MVHPYYARRKYQSEKNKGLAKPAPILLASRLLTPFSFDTTLYLNLGDKNQIEAEFLVLE